MEPSGNWAGAPSKSAQSLENDLTVFVRRETNIGGARWHIEPAPCGIEKTPDNHQPVLRTADDQIERRMAAKGWRIMRLAEPCHALMLIIEKHAQGLMNTQDRRNSREDINIQRESAMLARMFAPAMIG